MKKYFLIFSLTALIVLGGFMMYKTYAEYRRVEIDKIKALEARRASWALLKEHIRRAIKSYKGSASVVIVDLDTGWRIEYNKDELIPSASLVKIPIMMALFMAEKDGKIKFDEVLTLKRSDKTDGSGLLKNEPAGSIFKVDDLTKMMITESDNTAANILIEKIGMAQLNVYFARMGLNNTNLSRKMMDFKLRKDGVENFTTASEMAGLLEKIYRGRFMNKDVSSRCMELLAQQKIRDRIPKKLPPETVVAHKTGLENGVCHDVGIVYTAKGDFLIAILTKHNYKSARATKRFIAAVSLLVYNYYNGL